MQDNVIELVDKALSKLPSIDVTWTGKDLDVLADWFRAQGYKGVRSSGYRCIMANYLAAETGYTFVVTYDRWERDDVGWASEPWVSQQWKPVMTAFIAEFDNGRWPDLFIPDDTQL